MLVLVTIALTAACSSNAHPDWLEQSVVHSVQEDWWKDDLRNTPFALDQQQSSTADYQVDVLSSAGPRAYLLRNFLTHTEADHLINLAQDRLVKSTVLGAFGISSPSNVRTSAGASLRRGHDATVAAIEHRIAQYTKAPVSHGEGLHVLRYEIGEEYKPHHDYFYDERSLLQGGQRIGTVILYLSDGYKGGETVFPNSLTQGSHVHDHQMELSDCAQQGLAVKPAKGDALFFLSVQADGDRMDELSLHTSCPVIMGSKYVATKWLRSDIVLE
eukprot:gene3103-biopygen4754